MMHALLHVLTERDGGGEKPQVAEVLRSLLDPEGMEGRGPPAVAVCRAMSSAPMSSAGISSAHTPSAAVCPLRPANR